MKEKNKLIQIASILFIVVAVVTIILSIVNINTSLSSMTNLTAQEAASVEAQLGEVDMTMDDAMGIVSAIAYVGVGLVVVFNAVRIVVGILGLKKADQSSKFFTVWGIIFLVFGVLGLSGGVASLLGLCNLVGGIVAPILFIVGGKQNQKPAA